MEIAPIRPARPWLARSLCQAFEEARALIVARMAETAATRYLVPWLYAALERTWRTFLRYSHEQGLASRLFGPAKLFAPETLDGPRV